MQNWNQWQLPTGAITTSMPQPPVGYTMPGADPMAMMQAYMQYYNQPAPNGYTAEQWAAAQQQNWTQWQQWQQQYQQWQAQYGEKYQETMKQMSSQHLNLSGHAPPLPTMPPLPKEDFKPPLPPSSVNTYQFTNIPPPHQNNLPLFPTKQPVSSASLQLNVHSSQNPPLPPPLPLESAQSNDGNSPTKRSSNTVSESCSAKKLKNEDEELTDAEKTFDAQFKQWEEQFNDWKQQNINHPDKTHYKIYEAKWTSWREKLIERREMMRKKREQQKQMTAKADTEKTKNLPGGDKIMNILSSTENQGLINNLLGIGKTLGLTGKQNTGTLPPPPPPPQTTSNISSTTMTPAITTQQSTSQPLNTDTVSSWNAQQAAQWAAQFNSGMQNYSGFHNTPGSIQQSFGAPISSIHPPNFALPPPNVPNAGPNFLQPPPGVRSILQNRSSYGSSGNNLNMFGANEKASSDINRFGSNDPSNLSDYSGNFDATDNSTNDRMNNRKGSLSSTGSEYFRREIDKNLSEHNQFRSDGSFNYGNVRFNRGDENYKSIDETDIDGKNYNKQEERNFMEHSGNNQLNAQNSFNSINNLNNDCFNINRSGPGSSDRFGSGAGDRFGNSSDRYSSDRFGSRDRFGLNNTRFGSVNDRFGPSNNRFGPLDRFANNNDRFGSRNERFGQGSGLECDRFGPGFDHFSVSSSDNAGPGNNRFGRNMDHFEQNKGIDNARDNNNSRNFERNNQIEPSDELAPELKKLMEKRRAAIDVFKPSFHDSDKTVNVGSLRESFKKIAGDSPFISKSSTDFGQRDFGVRGMATFSPRFSGNFELPNNPRLFGPRGPNDFKPHGGGGFDFRLRGHANFSQRDKSFDSHDPNSPFIREPTPNFSKFDKNQSMFGSVDVDQRIEQQFDRGDPKLQQIKDIQNCGLSNDNVSLNTDNIITEKRLDIPVHKDETDNTVKAKEVSQTEKIGEEESSNNIADTQSNTQEDKSTRSDVLPLEKLSWMDASFPDVNLSKKDVNDTECNTKSSSNLTVPIEENNEKIDERVQAEHQSDQKLESNAPDTEQINKTEVLPFMGENDPKPEDLNMEPPPELPNLGPITDDLNNDNNTFANNPKIKEPFGTDRNFVGELERNSTKYFDPKNAFNPRGPNDGRFLQQPPPNNGQFSSLGPNDIEFRSRASIGGQLSVRGLNNRNFGPWRTNEMPCDNNRGFTDTQFGPKGPIDRLSSIININERNFNNRRSMDGSFDPQCSNDGSFPSGQFSHHNLQDRMLGPRNLVERHFDIRNTGLNTKPFGPRGGPFESPFESQGINNEASTRNYNNRLCSNRSPFGNKPSGAFDGALDSGNNDIYQDKFNENYLDRKLDLGITDTGSSIGSKLNSELGKMNKSDCKTFFQSNFSDTASRSQYGPDCPINLPSHEFKTNILSQISPFDKKIVEKSGIDSNIVGDSRIGYGEISAGLDYKYNNSPAFMKRPIDNPQSYMRGAPNKEFCIERQFNYNHGGATKDKKYTEHVPVKVIDYAHAPRTIMQEHLTPVQCFDYGHGKLKPVVPDHELLPKRDFRNWEESEQNLKEYVEKMKTYENSMVIKHEHRRKTKLNESKESDWTANIRKYEREKRNANDKKERECSQEERIYPNVSDKERDESKRIQSDKINDKDRGHERCERVQTDISKENDRENDRSKGRTNWQENSNKNTIETKSSNTSFTDKQQNVSELPSKTLELAKTANCTMVDDLLCPPGRQNRPSKIAIILRGPPGSGKSFVAKLIKDKEVEQGGSAPRILSLDDYFLVEKEIETKDDNGKKIIAKEMVYEYEDAMEPSYIVSLVKAFKKNITDGFFNFIILDCINEKISDYEDMWSFAKSKGFKVYVCEMEMDVQICLKRNIHNRSEDEINRIVDYFEPTPSYHQKLDVNSMLQEQAIEEVQMEDSQEISDKVLQPNEESQDSQDDAPEMIGISKWERMEAEDKLDRLDGLARKKNESKPQTMEDFLQVPDYYNMEDTSGKKRVRWADLEERKQQEKMRAVGFVVGHTNWDRMMDPTKGGSALTRTKYI
ncbi:PREDICTED: uncharacterized protein LOC106787329 isoform X2 [Polistes canadensis]|uniref:uncharacterized protein LOC106787329 isoform X2 n=1 Tax=Polistes canadensis TaxID=91411 RepID=UPI000718BA5C|nr:PREDICTED: uncharacterized protein LOC106787329 isoform X2 [Polistes canadensis]